jgi:hypothetical protein
MTGEGDRRENRQISKEEVERLKGVEFLARENRRKFVSSCLILSCFEESHPKEREEMEAENTGRRRRQGTTQMSRTDRTQGPAVLIWLKFDTMSPMKATLPSHWVSPSSAKREADY